VAQDTILLLTARIIIPLCLPPLPHLFFPSGLPVSTLHLLEPASQLTLSHSLSIVVELRFTATMGFLGKKQETEASNAARFEQSNPKGMSELPAQPKKVPFLAIFLGLVASIGGFMFGYESGQISGEACRPLKALHRPDFAPRVLCYGQLLVTLR